MPERVYKQFRAAEVVDGVGYATRVAGSCPHPDVLLALAGNENSPEVCFLYPRCLRSDEPGYIVTAICKIMNNTRKESP